MLGGCFAVSHRHFWRSGWAFDPSDGSGVVKVGAAIGATAAALAGRVDATADRLSAAARQYVTADETSAQSLASLGGGLVQP